MKKGFTLIEMVIVVAVIAILAGLLVPMVGGLIEEARMSRCKSELKQIATAILAYNAKKGSWPGNPNSARNYTYYRNAHGALNNYLAGAYGSFLNARVDTDPWKVYYSYYIPSAYYGRVGYSCMLMSEGPDKRNSGTWSYTSFRYGYKRGDDELILVGNPWGS